MRFPKTHDALVKLGAKKLKDMRYELEGKCRALKKQIGDATLRQKLKDQAQKTLSRHQDKLRRIKAALDSMSVPA